LSNLKLRMKKYWESQQPKDLQQINISVTSAEWKMIQKVMDPHQRETGFHIFARTPEIAAQVRLIVEEEVSLRRIEAAKAGKTFEPYLLKIYHSAKVELWNELDEDVREMYREEAKKINEAEPQRAFSMDE
jgi:hypothetical protein